MVEDYTIDISSGISFPLSDVESDEVQLGADVRAQISEMPSVNGPSTAEYGGEEPWVHQWVGTIRVDEMAHFRVPEDDTFENRVTAIVETLLQFFGNSETPNQTTVDEFEWVVQVNEESPSIRPDGVHTILISWEPTK